MKNAFKLKSTIKRNGENTIITDNPNTVKELKKLFQELLDKSTHPEQRNSMYWTVKPNQNVPGKEKIKLAKIVKLRKSGLRYCHPNF